MNRSRVRQQKVKELVTQFPFLTENTNQLVTYYWSHIEGAKDFTDVLMCSSSEAITRAFRRLVKSGEIVLSEEERERRQEHQESFREDYQPI